MLSDVNDYEGGGTFFVDLNERFVLERGDFLVHPGHLVHSGCEITAGTRYVMVYFLHFAPLAHTSHER